MTRAVTELQREKEENQEMELAVAAFDRQLASMKEKVNSLESEVEQYQAITENLTRGRSVNFDGRLVLTVCREEYGEIDVTQERLSHRPSAQV